MINSLKKQIDIIAYINDDGEPCCAKNFDTGEVCIFYRTKNFGTRELCIINDMELKRRKDGVGTLIPHKLCPIWNKRED